jgi:hypothetical protein
VAKLTAHARKEIPKSEFGIPSKAPGPGSYPMPDKAHAANAKARAAQHASPAEKARIDAKANRILGEEGDDVGMKQKRRRAGQGVPKGAVPY